MREFVSRSLSRVLVGLALLVPVVPLVSPPALAATTPPTAPQAMTLPNSGKPLAKAALAGYLPGSAGVSPTGAFTYSIPITVPEGRAGMAPQLTLGYASTGADGVFGLGWSMPGMMSSITRCPQTPDTEGSRQGVRYGKNDRFCLDGQKLVGLGPDEPGASGLYGDDLTVYGTVNDAFAKIVSVNLPGSTANVNTGPDQFVVYGKDGRISTYEAEVGARADQSASLLKRYEKERTVPVWFDRNGDGAVQEDEVSSYLVKDLHEDPELAQHSGAISLPRVMWLLRSVRDRSGNEMRYDYQTTVGSAGNEYLVSQIRYTFGQSRAAQRQVMFEYEVRPDPTFGYVSGVRFQQTKRVKSITLYAPDPVVSAPVRKYNLSYLATAPNGRNRSLLWRVQECGELGGCLPAKELTWSASGLSNFIPTVVGGQAVATKFPSKVVPSLHVQDLDGDGTDDIVYTGGGDWNAPVEARLGLRDSAGKVTPLANHQTVSGQGAWPAAGSAGGNVTTSRPLDITGDGRVELEVRVGEPGHNQVVQWDKATNHFISSGISFNDDSAWDDFGDVNGDGLVDRIVGVPLVESGNGDGPHANWNELRVAVQLNHGTYFDAPVVSNVDGNCPGRRVSDVDGDGRAEVVLDTRAGFTDWQNQRLCSIGEFTLAAEVDDNGGLATVPGRGATGTAPLKDGWRLPPLAPQSGSHLESTPEAVSTGNQGLNKIIENGLRGWTPLLGDFNGDGLQDTMLLPNRHGWTPVLDPPRDLGTWERDGLILWNTGDGLFWDGTTVNIPHDEMVDVRVGDMNGDGRDDVVSYYHTGVLCDCDGDPDKHVVITYPGQAAIAIMVSKGNGTFVNTTLPGPTGIPHPVTGRAFSQLGDFNGDGRLDLLKHDGSVLMLLTQQSPNDGEADRIIAVTDEGAGFQRQVVTYSRAWTDRPDLMTQYCTFPLSCLRRGLPVVRKIVSYENVFSDLYAADPVSTFYAYADPVAHVRQGFLGFGTTYVWQPERPLETITRYDVRTTAPGTLYGRYYPFAGRPREVTLVTPVMTPDKVAQHPATALARVTRTTYTDELRPLNSGATHAVLPDLTKTNTWDQPVSLLWDASLTGTGAEVHVGGVATVAPQNPDRHTETDYTYDNFGNLTDQNSATAGGVSESVHTDYDLSPQRRSAWLVSLPTTHQVTRSEAGGTVPVTRHTENHYDDLGRLDAQYLEKGSAQPNVRQSTTFERSPAGVVHKTTTSAPGVPDVVEHTEYAPAFTGQQDEEIYSSQRWFEHTVVVNGTPEPAKYRPSSWQAVHPAFGIPVVTLDLNGVTTSTSHDDLGRPVRIETTAAPRVDLSYQQYVNTQGGMGGLKVVTDTQTRLAPKLETNTARTVTDQVGRTRVSEVEGFDGATITTTTGYDSLGRVATQSRPYTGATAPGSTTYGYDSLDRPTSVTAPDKQTSTWQYPSFTQTKAFDVNGTRTDSTTDVDGRLTSTVTYHNTAAAGAPPVLQPVTTGYTYAPFDLLHTVTDDHKNVTTTNYDVLGRPTKVTDPDRGSITTEYYGTGLVHTVTSGNGDVSSFGYDDLGRATSRQDKDGATGVTTTTNYGFDTADHGIGQPAFVDSVDDHVRIDYAYDDLGRQRRVDTSTDPASPPYSVDYAYDAFGRVDTVSYPNVPGRARFAVRNGYNDQGYLRSISDATAGQPAQTLWQATARNADLALTGGQLSSAATGPAPVTLTRGYDPVTGRLQTQAATAGSGATLQSLTYGYWPNGLVHTRTQNDTAKRTEGYTYDDLGRLTSWGLVNATSAEVTTNYTYDSVGNLTAVSGPPQEAETRTIGGPNGTLPHALTSRKGETYHYDTRGRLYQTTAAGGETTDQITYTAFDLPKTYYSSLGSWTFRYDGYGARTVKTGPDGTTVYVNGLFEDRADTTGNHTYAYYVSSPDGTIGQAVFDGTATTFEYTLTDALASITHTVDPAGTAKKSFFHAPYGTRTNADGTHLTGAATGTLTHGFTGQEEDTALGNVNLNGRIYRPATKTFLTPDPVADPYSPQTLHPYSYVQNNPTNSTDPSGLCNYCPGGGVDPMQSVNDYLSSLTLTGAVMTGQTGLGALSPGMDLLGIGPMKGLDGLNLTLTGAAISDGGVFAPIMAKINDSIDDLAATLAEIHDTWEGLRSYPIKVGHPFDDYDDLADSTLGDAMDFAATASLAMDGIGEVQLIASELRAARLAKAADTVLAADAVGAAKVAAPAPPISVVQDARATADGPTIRIGEVYRDIYPGGAGIFAEVDEAGVLNLAIDVRGRTPGVPRGGEMFADAIGRLGPVNGVRGMWGTSMPSNLNDFNAALRANPALSLEDAALHHTFTGHMAQKYGFRTAAIEGVLGERGDYSVVKVLFQ